MPRPGPKRPFAIAALPALVLLTPAVPARGQVTDANGPPIQLLRIPGGIEVDGAIDDPGWAECPVIDEWFETNPGDNLPAPVGCRARLAYDSEFLYALFDFDDPNPGAIRCPLGDHDNISSATDYAGVILDARNDGKTAQMFLANARGLLYDAITSDASGEDSSPDFFWDAIGRITERGWQMEMRIPFSSIRYNGSNPEQWGILLYRNRPRDFRYQYFSSRLPRDKGCFICNVRPVVGMQDLPSGSHWVVAPYVSASEVAQPSGALGTSLERQDPEVNGGVDLKWLPNPDTVLDAAINPDFSQIESDESQITANERFAIFQPEKRPFFLESVDLFSTPISAVYTRSFTDPEWGTRATFGSETSKNTALFGRDHGGGLVILPGPQGSDFALQDFESWVVDARVRKDFGLSTLGGLYAGREIVGGGWNRVVGPDVVWRPNTQTTFTGQFLYSFSQTPNRPDLAAEWDGRKLDGHNGIVWGSWSNEHWDSYAEYDDVGDGFRADNGFVPRVGYRFGYAEGGRTFRPDSGAVRRLRLFTRASGSWDRDGTVLSRLIGPGFGLDAFLNSFVRLEFNREDVRGTELLHERFYVAEQFQIRPGKVLNNIVLNGNYGDQIDFANDRPATGGDLTGSVDVRPTDRLRLTASYRRRWLDVDAGAAGSGRFLTAQIPRLRGVYMFNRRMWVRAIGEWSEVIRHPELSPVAVDAKSSDFGGSALFAYKLNWQTVCYLGYSDLRQLDDQDDWQPLERQAFFKISYAFRH